MAYIASKSVSGHAVKLVCGREEDMIFSPGKIGLEAQIKIGAKRSGKITAAEIYFYVDCGAYSDIGALAWQRRWLLIVQVRII